MMVEQKTKIPNGWAMKTLDKISEIVGGGTPSTKESSYWGGDIPWITPKDLSGYQSIWINKGERFITKEGALNSSVKILPSNSVLFSSRAPIGYIAINTIPVATNQGFKSLIPGNSTDYKFLYYWLLKNKENIEKQASGSTFAEVSGSVMKNFEITLPESKKEQEDISAILWSLDKKIQLLRDQNKTLEGVVQSIFNEWFVSFNFPGANGKMVDSELGKIPESWNVGKLIELGGEITDFVANGSFASLKENVTLYDIENYALFLRNTDLKSKFKQKIFVDEHSYNFLKKTQMYGGEIIISNVGDVGSVYLCPFFNIPMVLGNNVIKLKSNYQSYLFTLFNNRIGQFLIESITGGSAQPKFNKTDFRNIKLIIPSVKILNQFENATWPLYIKLLKNDAQIQILFDLRDKLLPKLIKGELRVNSFNN